MAEKTGKIILDNNVSPAKVPAAVKRKWKEMYRHGDITAIRKATGCSRRAIGDAINNGVAQKPLQEAITKFFADRKLNESRDEHESEIRQLSALDI